MTYGMEQAPCDMADDEEDYQAFSMAWACLGNVVKIPTSSLLDQVHYILHVFIMNCPTTCLDILLHSNYV